MAGQDDKKKMSTQKKLMIGVAVLALVGAGVYVAMEMRKKSEEPKYRFEFY